MASAQPPPRMIVTTRAFERDVKRLKKRGHDVERLRVVVDRLRLRRPLETHHRDHALTGEWHGFRDCHIQPDWVLVYRVDDESVYLTRTESHSDLFG